MHVPYRHVVRRAAIIALAALLLIGSTGCSREDVPGRMESVRLGAVMLEQSIPVFVAEEEGLFTRNGLNVQIKTYESGLAAVNGLLQNEVDIAVGASEYVLVGPILNGKAVRILASIDEFDVISIVARKDRGIATVSDLKGKRIGIRRGTNLEFFLGRFLELHGLKESDITVVDVPVAQAADAVIAGEVDAIAFLPPYSDAARDGLGSNAVVWPAQSSQQIMALAVCADAWAKGHAGATRHFLRAISQAEQYIADHPVEAQAIAQKRLGQADAEMAEIWARNAFVLTLDQSLIVAMEDEARWMIRSGLTEAKGVPDFVNSLYLEGLTAVRPEAVNVIGEGGRP